MANRRPEPEPESEPDVPHFRPLGEERRWWEDDPRRREHVVAQIREFGIEDWHTYWGRTPIEVRRELIAEAKAGGPGRACY